MENNKKNKQIDIIYKNGVVCKQLSILGIFGFLFFIIALILITVSFFNSNLSNYFTFGNYLEVIIENDLQNQTGLTIAALIIFSVSMIFLSVSTLGTFIVSIILACEDRTLVKETNHSALVLSILTIFFAFFTGVALGNKIIKIVKNYNDEQFKKLETQNNISKPNNQEFEFKKPLNIKDTKIDFSNDNHIDKLKEKLDNIKKLKRDGYINDYEYTELKEKIISES